jgi:hypothetical protein
VPTARRRGRKSGSEDQPPQAAIYLRVSTKELAEMGGEAEAEVLMTSCQTRYHDVQDVLIRALTLAGSVQKQYVAASNTVRCFCLPP